MEIIVLLQSILILATLFIHKPKKVSSLLTRFLNPKGTDVQRVHTMEQDTDPDIFQITYENMEYDERALNEKISAIEKTIYLNRSFAKLELMDEILERKLDDESERIGLEELLRLAVVEHEDGPVTDFTAHTERIDGNTVIMTLKYNTPSETMRRREYPLHL